MKTQTKGGFAFADLEWHILKERAPVGSKESIANDIHLVAGAAVELLLVLVQVCDLKFSSTLVAFEAVLLENSRKLHF